MMLTKLKAGKYVLPSKDERQAFINEAERMIRTYHWEERSVTPYPRIAMRVVDMIDNLKDFDRCSYDSKCILVMEVNGLVSILNRWEEVALSPKVTFRFTNGNMKELPQLVAEDYVECGMGEIVGDGNPA